MIAGTHTFLLDAPDAPPASGTDARPASLVQIAKTGTFRHPRYGMFKITPDTFDSFARNLPRVLTNGQAPVDFDHTPDLGGPSRACGWITGLHPNGDRLDATIEWTPEGEDALRTGAYKFFSPTWHPDFPLDTGEKIGPTLLGGALTNRPYFSGLAVVSLSRHLTDPDMEQLAVEIFAVTDKAWDGSASRFTDEQWRRSCILDRGDSFDTAKTRYALPVREPDGTLNKNGVHAAAGRINQVQASPDAVAAARSRLRGCYREMGEDPPDSMMPKGMTNDGPPDSRVRAMSEYANIAPILKLNHDAEEGAVIAAITQLAAQSENAIPDGHVAVPLARLAELEAGQKIPPGHVIVLATRYETLERQEGEAATLREQLGDLRFERAFTHAVGEARVTPAEKEYFARLFKLDAELAEQMLRDRPPVVITSRRGDSGRIPGEAPDNVDPESWDLDRKVQSYLRSEGMGPDEYTAALDKVLAREGMR